MIAKAAHKTSQPELDVVVTPPVARHGLKTLQPEHFITSGMFVDVPVNSWGWKSENLEWEIHDYAGVPVNSWAVDVNKHSSDVVVSAGKDSYAGSILTPEQSWTKEVAKAPLWASKTIIPWLTSSFKVNVDFPEAEVFTYVLTDYGDISFNSIQVSARIADDPFAGIAFPRLQVDSKTGSQGSASFRKLELQSTTVPENVLMADLELSSLTMSAQGAGEVSVQLSSLGVYSNTFLALGMIGVSAELPKMTVSATIHTLKAGDLAGDISFSTLKPSALCMPAPHVTADVSLKKPTLSTKMRGVLAQDELVAHITSSKLQVSSHLVSSGSGVVDVELRKLSVLAESFTSKDSFSADCSIGSPRVQGRLISSATSSVLNYSFSYESSEGLDSVNYYGGLVYSSAKINSGSMKFASLELSAKTGHTHMNFSPLEIEAGLQ